MAILKPRPSHLPLVAVALAVLAVLTAPAAAETRVGGVLKGETVWSKAGSPYLVTEDVEIPRGATLRVEPGVTVRFKPDITDMHGDNGFDLEILVSGKLVVRGAEGDTVYFTSDAPTPKWTDWGGLVAKGPSGSIDLQAVVVEYANTAVSVTGGTITARDVTFQLCSQQGVFLFGGSADLNDVVMTRIGNPSGTGMGLNADRKATVKVADSFIVGAQNGIVFSDGSGGTVDNTAITVCTGFGITVKSSDPVITHCTVTGNDYGIVLDSAGSPTVKQNNIFDNGTAELVLKNFRKGDPVQVDFSGNWWGTTELARIQEGILDGVRDPSVKAVAVVEPYLQEAVTPGSGEDAGR